MSSQGAVAKTKKRAACCRSGRARRAPGTAHLRLRDKMRSPVEDLEQILARSRRGQFPAPHEGEPARLRGAGAHRRLRHLACEHHGGYAQESGLRSERPHQLRADPRARRIRDDVPCRRSPAGERRHSCAAAIRARGCCSRLATPADDQRHRREPVDAERARRRRAEVDHPPAHERAAVVDAHHDRAAVVAIDRP